MSSGTGNGLGVQPSKLVRLPLALGTRSATCLPRLMISMVSPLSSHLESRAKSFRKSRTVAVFMVIHLYHERKMSTPKCRRVGHVAFVVVHIFLGQIARANGRERLAEI